MIKNKVGVTAVGAVQSVDGPRRLVAFCSARAGAGNNYWRVSVLKPDAPLTNNLVGWDQDIDFPVFVPATTLDAHIDLRTKILEKLGCNADEIKLIVVDDPDSL